MAADISRTSTAEHVSAFLKSIGCPANVLGEVTGLELHDLNTGIFGFESLLLMFQDPTISSDQAHRYATAVRNSLTRSAQWETQGLLRRRKVIDGMIYRALSNPKAVPFTLNFKLLDDSFDTVGMAALFKSEVLAAAIVYREAWRRINTKLPEHHRAPLFVKASEPWVWSPEARKACIDYIMFSNRRFEDATATQYDWFLAGSSP